MARLNNIVERMKILWPYGDKDFSYTFQVNEKHNTQYPYIMINPPNSEMPEIYGGWEAYDFEIDFFDTYKTANRDAVSLTKEWDNLQDFALEWFDNLMIFYNNPGGSDVGVYFLEETLNFERVKDVANDKLVQIKMFFTLRSVTRCLGGNIPMTYYPNQISDLMIWLSADANVTEDIPTKRVSAWGDRSGRDNNVYQTSDVTKQPLRYTYDNGLPYLATFNEKTRIDFPETVPGGVAAGQYHLFSDTMCPITANDFTIFTVTNSDLSVTGYKKIFGYIDSDTTAEIEVGVYAGNFRTVVKDGSGNTITLDSVGANPMIDCITSTKLSGDTLTNTVNNAGSVTATTVGFDGTGNFDNKAFAIGGTIGGAALSFYAGALAEVVVYNRALNTTETTDIYNYLNNKYKIY